MVSFYRFHPKQQQRQDDDVNKNNTLEQLRDSIFDSLSQTIPGVRGSLYLAQEGFNGQFAIPIESMDAFGSVFETTLKFDPNEMNLGDVVPIETPTFQRLIIRTRDFILRDGLNTDDVVELDWDQAGDELSPEEWHEELLLLQNNNNSSSVRTPLILDCRNDYESNQGTFQQAIPLNTTTFAESWNVLQEFSQTGILPSNNHNNPNNKDDPIYIFCTGGIRCVKVGAYMKQSLGYTNVKRLKHGIIGYQKWWNQQQEKASTATTATTTTQSQKDASLWEGENFLFDKRRFAAEEEGEQKTKRDSHSQ